VATTALDIVKEYARLVVTEFRLLRTELAEKIGQIGLGLAFALIGLVLFIMAVVLLFVAAISAIISYGFSLTAASLIVFAIVIVLGAGCAWFGIRQLQLENLIPRKTIAQVQKDFEAIAPEAN
jgi:uncharacterized membrane protein YqjE